MERLKDLREEALLKQKDIAELLGIDRSTYTSYEIERDTIPIKHLNKLCNYFNVSIDFALGLTKTKKYSDLKEDINNLLTLERIKELRKEYKITQVNIAKLFNITRSTWTGYEYGINRVPTLILLGLSQKFNYSVDYLLGKTNTKYIK